MSLVENDHMFREFLDHQDVREARELGAAFVRNVQDLNDDARLDMALETASKLVVSDEELQAAYKAAHAAAMESFTRCGAYCDWADQASHFVARATAALVNPNLENNRIWQVANTCRMARNCAMLADGEDAINPEVAVQYRLLNEFLESKELLS